MTGGPVQGLTPNITTEFVMTTFLLVSVILLWAFAFVLGFLLLGTLRSLGLLQWRFDELEATRPVRKGREGLAPGNRAPDFTDTFNELATQAATNVSRRQFLGRVSRGAAVVAAALGGLLATRESAWAGRKIRMCADPSTVGPCSGKPLGSPCGVNNEGRCASSLDEISPGVYNCNFCRTKGGRKPPKGSR